MIQLNQPQVNIHIAPRSVVRFLSFMVLGLILFSVTSCFLLYVVREIEFEHLLEKFYVDSESSISTWYSSFTLLFCSLLLAVIAISKQKANDLYTRYWQGLALIFLFLSIDEAVGLHELMIERTRVALNTSGIFYFAWIIPASVLVAIFVLAYLRLLLSLPSATRALWITAGTTFLSGTLGVEMLGGWYAEKFGVENFTYAMIATLEELLEMVGILIFVYALLSYIQLSCKTLNIQFTRQQNSSISIAQTNDYTQEHQKQEQQKQTRV
jgi:hypothetical protein